MAQALAVQLVSAQLLDLFVEMEWSQGVPRVNQQGNAIHHNADRASIFRIGFPIAIFDYRSNRLNLHDVDPLLTSDFSDGPVWKLSPGRWF